MSEELETARRYRHHADELRALAGKDHATNHDLLQIAEDYDRMAATLEAIDRTNRRLGKTRTRN